MKKHVRALSWAADRTKTQGHRRHAECLPVKITEMLRGQFTHPIRRYRSCSAALPHRQIVGITVDGGRRSIDEFSDLDLLASFQQNLRRQYIVVGVMRELRPPTGANPRMGR